MNIKVHRVAEPAPSEKRARGRPRSTEVEHRLLRASLEVLAEGGFSGLTVESVCVRAGVPKATFYRRWSAPVFAVLDALQFYTRDFVLEDTGDVAADLFTYMKRVVALLSDPVIGVCRNFMFTEARIRPDIAKALSDSGRAKIARDRADLAAALRRQGVKTPVSAGVILNVISGVAFNVATEWPIADQEKQTWATSDRDMRKLIATLLGDAL
jgi:AcrR family transcriptional regulator